MLAGARVTRGALAVEGQPRGRLSESVITYVSMHVSVAAVEKSGAGSVQQAAFSRAASLSRSLYKL